MLHPKHTHSSLLPTTMDFLRNIASAALQSTGVSFPFTIGDRIPGTEGKTIWDVREGVKKASDSSVVLASCRRIDIDCGLPGSDTGLHVSSRIPKRLGGDLGRLDPVDVVHIRFDAPPTTTRKPGSESSIQYRQECVEEAPIYSTSQHVSLHSMSDESRVCCDER
jgi:hypothetical protein